MCRVGRHWSGGKGKSIRAFYVKFSYGSAKFNKRGM